MATQKQPAYHSYLLRLWQENSGSLSQWRATLESAQTGAKYQFASLEALFAFIRRRGVAINYQQVDQVLPPDSND